MYMGEMPGRFAAPLQLPDWDHPEIVDWRQLCKLRRQSLVEEYQLQVTEVTAELPDIIELFVRINSTGNALTPQEVRGAKFYRSEFLKLSRKLASRYELYLQSAGVIGAQQAQRMKHIESIGELLYAAHIGGVANKKRVLDTAMRAGALVGLQLRKAEHVMVAGLNTLKRMSPDLARSVRVHKISDFYSLAVVVQGLGKRGCILDNRKRNLLAWDLPVVLSSGADELSDRSKNWTSRRSHREKNGKARIQNLTAESGTTRYLAFLSQFSKRRIPNAFSVQSNGVFCGTPQKLGFAVSASVR
jgi:hypothetical protein